MSQCSCAWRNFQQTLERFHPLFVSCLTFHLTCSALLIGRRLACEDSSFVNDDSFPLKKYRVYLKHLQRSELVEKSQFESDRAITSHSAQKRNTYEQLVKRTTLCLLLYHKMQGGPKSKPQTFVHIFAKY